MKNQKEIEQLQQTIKFYEAALQFAEFSQDQDIYNSIGDQLQKYAGKDSYVVVNSIDTQKNILTNRAINGVGNLSEKVAAFFGKNPVGMSFNLNDKDLYYLADSKLHVYKDGLYGIILKTIPKALCDAFEKLMKIKTILTIGFMKDDELFGTAIILLKEDAGEIKNISIIEAFIKQASMTIQKRQAEEKLKKNEYLFRLITENAFDFIWTLDMEMNVTYSSDSVYRLLGYTQEEIMKINVSELCSPEQFKAVQGTLVDELAKGIPHQGIVFTVKHLRKDRTEFPAEIKAKIIYNEKNEPILIQGYTRDISEQLAAQEALFKSEAHYRQLFNSLPYGGEIIDLKGKIVNCSQNTMKMLGYEKDEIIGKHMTFFVDTETKKKFKHVFPKLLKGESLFIEACLVHKNGSKINVLRAAQPIFNAEKRVEGMLALSVDITERKQAEEELIKHREHLEELVKERTTELEEKNEKLEHFNKLFVGREFRIKELRDRVKELEEKISE